MNDNEIIGEKRGRPKKDGTRTYQLKVLLTKEEYDLVMSASKLGGKSKSEIVRPGIIDSAKKVISVHDMEDDGYDYYDYEEEEDDYEE